VLATSGFAFMASNTVGTSYAGQGRGAIAGYTVSDVHYAFVNDTGNNPNLDYIKSVTFTLDHHAGSATADINNNQSWVPYHDCSSSDGYTWTCANSTGAAANLNYPGGSPSASQLNVDAAS
jgi:hypothetical protein